MANLNFNAAQVDPSQAFDPVPAGWYAVKIVESEMKPTRDGNGAYLQLEMEILNGPHAGRKLWDRLNLQNRNSTAVEIAYSTLSAICHATGVIQCQDSQQLHGIPMEAKVTVRAASDNYDASNDIRGYRATGQGNGNGMNNPNQGGVQNPAMNQNQQQNNQQQQGGWFANQNNQQQQQQQNNGGGWGADQNNVNQQQQQNVQQNNGGWVSNQNNGNQQQNVQQQNVQQQNQNQNQNHSGFDPAAQQQHQNQNNGNGQADGGSPSAGQDGELPPWMQNNG